MALASSRIPEIKSISLKLSDPLILIFLSSALFLGWSLGANDAANVFGTAVGSRMVSFTKAAFICGIFVILGAVVSGAGAAQLSLIHI